MKKIGVLKEVKEIAGKEGKSGFNVLKMEFGGLIVVDLFVSSNVARDLKKHVSSEIDVVFDIKADKNEKGNWYFKAEPIEFIPLV